LGGAVVDPSNAVVLAVVLVPMPVLPPVGAFSDEEHDTAIPKKMATAKFR
jgi:hypothetical protein